MNIQSYSQFLFGQSANAVFDMSKIVIPQGVDKTKFVEQCLELAVKVNVYLFTHKDAIMLIDPRAFNKQCQLYALRACQIQREYPHRTEEEKMSATDENRFLHLGFLLNYEFRDKINYEQTVLTTLQRMDIKPYNAEFTAKGFKTFLKDRERHLEQAARMAFNRLFKEDIQSTLESQKETNALTRELSLLAHENLMVPGTSLGVKGELLYTYPKLAGLAFLMDTLARESLPFILKVKVVNQEGSGGIVRYESRPIADEDPVVVFSAFATDGSVSVMDAMEKAKKCPTYLYRHSQAKTRHPDSEKCFYCTPVEMDMVAQQERLDRVMKQPTDLIYSLGVEFMEQEQTAFLPFFKDSEKYPELQRLFAQSAVKPEELETNGVRSLAIYHTFTEIGRTAKSDEFALDFSPERFLKAKEIVQPYRTKLGLGEFYKGLSRAQRKEIMNGFEKELNQQGFTTVKTKHKK